VKIVASIDTSHGGGVRRLVSGGPAGGRRLGGLQHHLPVHQVSPQLHEQDGHPEQDDIVLRAVQRTV